MSSTELPQSIATLLWECCESYEDLELLLLLRRTGGAIHSPGSAAAALRIDETLAADGLARLAGHGLASETGSPSSRSYRYLQGPRDEAVVTLAGLLESSPQQVLRVLASNAIRRIRGSAIRAFADSFIIRKEGKHG